MLSKSPPPPLSLSLPLTFYSSPSCWLSLSLYFLCLPLPLSFTPISFLSYFSVTEFDLAYLSFSFLNCPCFYYNQRSKSRSRSDKSAANFGLKSLRRCQRKRKRKIDSSIYRDQILLRMKNIALPSHPLPLFLSISLCLCLSISLSPALSLSTSLFAASFPFSLSIM